MGELGEGPEERIVATGVKGTNGHGGAEVADFGGASDEMDESLSETDDIMANRISIEDASSLLEPSISLLATRYKSARTPAVEKAKILEEDGGYFEEETLAPETSRSDEDITPTPQDLTLIDPPKSNPLTLGKLPSPKLLDPENPITPWQAGPKKIQIERRPTQPQSSLQGVFRNRARSLSGGAEALKKILPKSLPSMAQVGSYFTSSSGSPTKSRFGLPSSPTFPRETTRLRKQDRSSTSLPSSGSTTPRFESIISTSSLSPSKTRQDRGGILQAHQTANLRRVNSDESLLYHSLSRASSLGDDTRFENQHEMVNSRVKAIRDSLQDRSSFRMPQIPSLPNLNNFSFNMNFLNANNPGSPPKSSTTLRPSSLTSQGNQKKPNEAPSSVVVSSMTAAAVAKPDTAAESVRAVVGGPNTDLLDRALENLTGDIVIMGGYRGSVLRSAKTNRQLWVPVKVGLNIRKVDLEVGLEPEDEERMEETIYSSGMLQNIGPVDISKRLFKRLNECENTRSGKLRVWDYGYDWRLSPHLLSRKLNKFLKGLPSNQPGGAGALVIAHSLGGLITRHVANHHPQLFSGIIYAGVPHSCVNILGPLRNGDAVLLSSRVLTAQVNFTLRTSFVLLPEDGGCFFDINTKEKYPVDFFNVDDWIKYRLSPCTDPPFPPRNPQPPQGAFEALMNLSNNLMPSQRRNTISFPSFNEVGTANNNDNQKQSSSPPTKITRAADVINQIGPNQDRTLGMQMDSKQTNRQQTPSISTTVTIPRPIALKYLTRVLRETKTFKHELHHNPALTAANLYPPLAVIYGKSIPTVFGAKVDGREGIACSDSYDNLAFASGDGVCLAREAMLPEGYKCVSGGRISSDRGHVTLLGDLNAVGRALEAVVRGRGRGIGLGGVEAVNSPEETIDPKAGSEVL